MDSSGNGSGFAAHMETARDIALKALCQSLTCSMSTEIRRATLKQLLPAILKNPCRGSSNCSGIETTTGSHVFLSWIGFIVKYDTEMSYNYIMPFIESKMSSNDDEQDILWYHRILECMIINSNTMMIIRYQKKYFQLPVGKHRMDDGARES